MYMGMQSRGYLQGGKVGGQGINHEHADAQGYVPRQI